MQAILASRRRQQVPQPRLTNLQTALTHMPDATPAAIDENLTAWYDLLQGEDGPTTTAATYTDLCSELRAKGNPDGHGPQLLLYNLGQGQCHLISCLFERPASIPDMPADSAFTTAPYIAIAHNRATPDDEWAYAPATAATLFAPKTAKLTSWDAIKAPPRSDRGAGYAKPRAATPDQTFFPLLPIYGRHISTDLVQLLYPPGDNNQYTATLKQVGHLLKPYVDSIPTEATRTQARASLAGLLTNSTAGRQAGTITLEAEAADPPAAKAAIRGYVDGLITKTLNPHPLDPIVDQPAHPNGRPGDANTAYPTGTPGNTQTSYPGGRPGDANTAYLTGRPGNSNVDPTAHPNGRPGDANTAYPTGTPGNTQTSYPGERPGDANTAYLTGRPGNSNVDQTAHPGGRPGDANPTYPPGRRLSLGVELSPPAEHHQARFDDPRQARYDAVFTSVRENPRQTGWEPEPKHPRHNTDTGFNSLSDFKKCQLMSIANVSSADLLNSHLKTLHNTDKTDRPQWFKINLKPLLLQRDPEAFTNFDYPAEFFDQFCDVKLTAPSTDSWWECFVAHQIRRSKEDIQHLNRLHSSRGDHRLQLQITPGNLAQLSSKAPVPISTLSELFSFLKRVWHCSTLFFPCCHLGHLAKAIYQALLEQRHALETDTTWLSFKPGEIVYHLCRAAELEFTHCIPLRDFLEGRTDGAYQPPNTATLVDKCVSPAPSINQNFLPRELRQRAPPLPPPAQLPGPTQRPAATGARHRGAPTLPTRGSTTTNNGAPPPAPRGDPGGRTNPHYHPHFKTFWQSLPQDQQNSSILPWLSRANTSNNNILDTLGLTPDDCGKFHIRGACQGRLCHRRHNPRPLDPRQVDAVIAVLHHGRQQLS